jgi:hypothetical protein
MKTASKKTKSTDFKVWCESCCVRIASNEERIERTGKSYHPRCMKKSRGFPNKPASTA